MTVFRNNRQQSSAARARRAVSVLQPLWKAALCWGGWVLEGFVACVQLRASPIRVVLFVLSTGLTWGRLTDRVVVWGTSFWFLLCSPTWGWMELLHVCCLLTLSSGGRGWLGEANTETQSFSVLSCQAGFSWAAKPCPWCCSGAVSPSSSPLARGTWR